MASLLVLTALATAQPYQKQQAISHATALAKSSVFQDNVRLRFAVLTEELNRLNQKGDVNDVLRFFSDTRVMVWNNPVPEADQARMLALEEQMQALAESNGRNLDLPPVGYAPRGRATLMLTERLTANGMNSLILNTERLATEVLSQSPSAELRALRDSLTLLREDFSDGRVQASNVTEMLQARVDLALRGPAALQADPRLSASLNSLVTAIRGNVTTAELENRDQGISLID